MKHSLNMENSALKILARMIARAYLREICQGRKVMVAGEGRKEEDDNGDKGKSRSGNNTPVRQEKA